MQTINCEITKVFNRNEKTVGFSLRPLQQELEDSKKIEFFKTFTKWNGQYNNCSSNMFHNNKPNPEWLVENAQISCDWINNNGWLNIEPVTVELIKMPDTDKSDDEFNDAINELDDSFDTDQLEKEALKDLEQKDKSKDKSNVTNLKPKVVGNNINPKKLAKINELTDNYGDVFLVVNSHPNLVSLPLEEKTKITTHINITLSQQGY